MTCGMYYVGTLRFKVPSLTQNITIMGKIEFLKAVCKLTATDDGFIKKAIKNKIDLKKVSLRKRTVPFNLPKEVDIYRIVSDGEGPKVGESSFTIDDLTLNRVPKICDKNGRFLFGEHSVICEYQNYNEGISIDICVIYESNDWYYRRWYKVMGKASSTV